MTTWAAMWLHGDLYHAVSASSTFSLGVGLAFRKVCPSTFTFSTFLFLIFWHFRATFAAYASSWVRRKWELQLWAYTTATATPEPSHICELRHNVWQCWILNSLSKARDQTCLFMDTNRVVFCFVLFLSFLGLHSQHMEIPRLGV